MSSLLKDRVNLGGFFSKNSLLEIMNEPNLKLVRGSLYCCQHSNSTFLFVDLVKVNKSGKFKFNDKYQREFFHWDSQTTQHISSPKIFQQKFFKLLGPMVICN